MTGAPCRLGVVALILATECSKGGNASSIVTVKLKRGAMFRSLLSLALAIALGAIDAIAQTQAPAEHAKMEAFVDGAVREAMGAEKIAGVSVAIVDRAGVVMTRGYGAAAFEPYQKADADTLFRVGSISKTPVWIAIMQLVEEGQLSLDDPINDRLPPSLGSPTRGSISRSSCAI
jgi:CubicO group peptidase (beta-lactamase class C family)